MVITCWRLLPDLVVKRCEEGSLVSLCFALRLQNGVKWDVVRSLVRYRREVSNIAQSHFGTEISVGMSLVGMSLKEDPSKVRSRRGLFKAQTRR
jgi:hypothetical protein